MRTPKIPYPGAKGRMAPLLVSMMPKSGRKYVEPFVGRGNVFFVAAMSLQFNSWVINDTQTADFFHAISTCGHSVSVPERTREEYVRQKQLFAAGDSRAVLLEPYLTFSGGGYRGGGFGGLRSASAQGYQHTLRSCAEIMRKTRPAVLNHDWQALNLTKLGESDFVFLDPPYFGADVRAYHSRLDYPKLVTTLKTAKFRWMLTEYQQSFYVAAFGQPCYSREVQLACDGRGHRSRVECVWKNF